jgi:hypothetical protein
MKSYAFLLITSIAYTHNVGPAILLNFAISILIVSTPIIETFTTIYMM